MHALLPLLLAANTTASAQANNPCASLDLPSALALAARRSDEVAIAQAELQAAEADRALATALRWIPSATATVVAGPVPAAHGNVTTQPNDPISQGTSNRSLNGLGPFGRIDAQVIQPIWTWGQLDAARDAANAGVAARTLLVRDQISTVQLRVIQLFYAQALARKLLGIAADVESALKEVDAKIAEALKSEDGSVSTEDRYRVQLFKAQLASRKADAQKALDESRIALAATLSLDPAGVTFDDIALDTSGPDAPPVAALLDAAASQRPDLLALGEAIKARRAEVKANEAAMLPAFFVLGQFSFAYAPNRDLQTNPWVNDPFRELGGGVVVGARQNLALPLMKATLDKSRAELGTLEAQQHGLRELVRVQVQSAAADVTAARAHQLAAQSALGSGKAWFRSAALNFGLGVDDAKALLEAYAGYVESQVGQASASYELIVARKKLDQITGVPLSNGEGKCVLP